jgi:hypothetical protein
VVLLGEAIKGVLLLAVPIPHRYNVLLPAVLMPHRYSDLLRVVPMPHRYSVLLQVVPMPHRWRVLISPLREMIDSEPGKQLTAVKSVSLASNESRFVSSEKRGVK